MTIFITGVSRGIGLELATQALARGEQVIGAARSPDKSEGLSLLQKRYGNQFQIFAVDVASPDLTAQLAKATSHLSSLDVLINNAGVYKEGEGVEDFLESFRINSIAPLQVTRCLMPLLKKSKTPKAIHITSKMGSITDNSGGGAYAYRASKAALNMINKSLTVDQDWLLSLVIHPGWVKTDMGGAQAPTEVTQSAKGIWSVILGLSSSDRGKFFDYTGQTIPW